MKVKDLIELLQEQDQDKPVYFSYPYGDYGRTTAAVEATEVNEATVKEWEYGRCHRVDEDADYDAIGNAIVIS